jgi:uncharacterized sodium:solute symporter family permease YidK
VSAWDWWVIAAYLGSTLGMSAWLAGGGVTWLQYELMVPVAMIVILVVLMPLLRGLQVISVCEYLERRFDRPTRLVLSAVFLLARCSAAAIFIILVLADRALAPAVVP